MTAAADAVSQEHSLAAEFGMRRNPFAGAGSPDQTDGENLERLVDDVRATVVEGHLLTVVTGASRARQAEFADRLAKTFGEEIRFLSLHGDKLNFAPAGNRPGAPAKLHESIEKIEFVVESAIRQGAHIDHAGLLVDHADGLGEQPLLTLLNYVERLRSKQPPVQLVLIGTEDILQALTDAACARFGDLAARHFSLDRLTEQEARALVARRVEQAGGRRDLFEGDEALRVAHELTRGYADVFMGLCSWAMRLAAERDERALTPALVREAAETAILRPPAAAQAAAPTESGSYEVFQPGKLVAFGRPSAVPIPPATPSGRKRGGRRATRPPDGEDAARASDSTRAWFAAKPVIAAAAALVLAVAIGWALWRGLEPGVDREPAAEIASAPDTDTSPVTAEPAEEVPALEELPPVDPEQVETPALVDIRTGEVRTGSGEAADELEAAPDEPAPQAQAEPADPVAELLDTARRQFAARKLSTPEDDNARDTYLAVLQRDPSNAAAREGLEQIEATYLEWADRAMSRQEWGDAEVYLRRAQAMSPGDAAIASALERLLARPGEVAEPAAAVEGLTAEDEALLQAARVGNVVAIAQAAERGAALDARDERGKTSLMWAAEQGDLRAARQLEARGADVSLASETGDTALMYAAQAGRADIVRFLISNGAALDRANDLGWTPLMYAAVGGHEAAVRELLAQGADVNAQSQDGKSPLMAAARNGHAAVVDTLIDAGARVDQTDRSGWTSLMYAAWQGHTGVADALLADNAALDLRNSEGQTALTLGIVRRNRDIIDRLVQAGARR